MTQNNARDALIQVNDRREKILYFEGEPRYEMKFVRRGVEEDKNIQVTILLRTAENKYWRGDVSDKDELIVADCDLDATIFGKETIFDFKSHRRGASPCWNVCSIRRCRR